MGILCVSVDLDEVRCYHEIHGLEPPVGETARAVHERALPRALRFFDELGLRGTFFAVGRELASSPANASLLRDASGRGHEIANHGFDHRYDLTLLPATDQLGEIRQGSAAIVEATGIEPRGFRAPGYNVHLGLLDLLDEQGYAYDSSVFPCPSYQAARAVAIAAKAVRGRESHSLPGDPRMLLAPTSPYRVGREGAWTRGEGLLELPITVVTPARLPLIGTSLIMARPLGASLLALAASRLGFVNLELHGIDFADAAGDGLGRLARHQPDLRVPLTKKIAALKRAIETLLDAGAQPLKLGEAAGRVLV
jgi:peptidoglycan-N-acetylglucosamine deacetylase